MRNLKICGLLSTIFCSATTLGIDLSAEILNTSGTAHCAIYTIISVPVATIILIISERKLYEEITKNDR